MVEHAYRLVNLPTWAVIKDARRRQRRRRIGIAAFAAAALLAGASEVLLPGRASTGQPELSSAAAGEPSRQVRLGGYIWNAAAGSHRVWVLSCVRDCTSISRHRDLLTDVDPASGKVVRRFALTGAIAIATGDHSIWIAHFFTGEITRFDPRTGRTQATIRLRLPTPIVARNDGSVVRRDRRFLPSNISYANGYVLVSTARGWVAQISARTGKVVTIIPSPSEDNSAVTDGHGTWVAEELDGLGFLRPHRNRLAIHPVRLAGQTLVINSVIRGAGLIWATGLLLAPTKAGAIVVTMIDQHTRHIVHQVQVPEAADGTDPVFAADALYLGDLRHGRLYRIAPNGKTTALKTRAVRATLATATPGELWAITHTKPGRLFSINLGRLTDTTTEAT